MTHEEIFGRTALLAGDEMMARLNASRVIVFGVGGVGSWCAEALVRSGIGHITIVDSDTIAASNINRQLPALTSTVGASKVETLADRFRDINPAVDVRAIKALYNRESAPSFEISTYDYVIDAIDSLDCKAALILEATSYKNLKFFSSMGAALKLSASKIATAEFWKVEGCPLARALRQKFKRSGQMPRRKFMCVYSPELLRNRKTIEITNNQQESNPGFRKAVINGTFAHSTAIFGLQLAGLVIEDFYQAE